MNYKMNLRKKQEGGLDGMQYKTMDFRTWKNEIWNKMNSYGGEGNEIPDSYARPEYEEYLALENEKAGFNTDRKGMPTTPIKMKKGGFPDNNKDGKITQADIFLQKKKTGTIKKKGGAKKKMYGGNKKMMGMGGSMKKTMYKDGGFLIPPTEEI